MGWFPPTLYIGNICHKTTRKTAQSGQSKYSDVAILGAT